MKVGREGRDGRIEGGKREEDSERHYLNFGRKEAGREESVRYIGKRKWHHSIRR